MGIDTSTVLAIGKLFDDQDDAVEFLLDKNKITQEQADAFIDNESDVYFEEFVYSENELGIHGGTLNAYTGKGFWLGYHVDTESSFAMLEDIKRSCEAWKILFDEEPEVINEVHIW